MHKSKMHSYLKWEHCEIEFLSWKDTSLHCHMNYWLKVPAVHVQCHSLHPSRSTFFDYTQTSREFWPSSDSPSPFSKQINFTTQSGSWAKLSQTLHNACKHDPQPLSHALWSLTHTQEKDLVLLIHFSPDLKPLSFNDKHQSPDLRVLTLKSP